MLKYYIYLIRIGIYYYIGSTKDIEKRQKDHMLKMRDIPENHRHNVLLYKTMREVGDADYQLQIVDEIMVESKTDARICEQIEMEKYPVELLLNVVNAYASAETIAIQRAAAGKRYYELKKQSAAFVEKHNRLSREYMAKLRADPVRLEEYRATYYREFDRNRNQNPKRKEQQRLAHLKRKAKKAELKLAENQPVELTEQTNLSPN